MKDRVLAQQLNDETDSLRKTYEKKADEILKTYAMRFVKSR